MKTITVSVATTPAGHEVLPRDWYARKSLEDVLLKAANTNLLDVFTVAQGAGIDDLTGAQEPCVTLVLGAKTVQQVVDFKADCVRIAKQFHQRSVAFVVGDTEILEVE